MPSQSPNGGSVSAAASGAVCQWQTSSTDRRGSRDRPLGNVPPGRSGPEGRAKSRLPLWGRWTRVSEDGEGKVPAAPSHGLCGSAGERPSQSPSGDSSPEGRAKSRLPLWGRCPPREGGEGKPLARSPASGKLPSRCAAVRERRGEAPVSLAFSHALRAYKGKVVGLWSHLPVRSAQGVCHRQTAPYNPQLLKKLAKLLRSLRSASCAHVRYPLDEHERQRAAKGAT